MRNVRNFNVRKRHLNMQGKNIMRGQSIKVHKEKPEEIKGYGVSQESERIDAKEKEPMTKLQDKLSKIQIKFK